MKRCRYETPRTPKMQLTAFKENCISPPKEYVNAYCRLKHLQDPTISTINILSSTTLSLPSESKNAGRLTNYTFKHIFTPCIGQQEVFETVALPLLEDLLNGRSGLLFTYGVTGSGKTFTLTGEQSIPGIIPRCIYTLFNTIDNDQHTPKYVIKSDRLNGFEVLSESDALEERFKAAKSKIPFFNFKRVDIFTNSAPKILDISQSTRFAVFISYIEIYNNSVYDLLDDTSKVPQTKILREDSTKGMYVNGAVEVEVKTVDEAFDVFYFGQMRKRTENTILNATSSRSHSIFIIRIVQLESNRIKTSQLSLVDLAGSERSKRAHTTGARLKEASCINNSLMTLRTCLEILRENQLNGTNRLVPYRDSRLTLLFKSYFEGFGQVRVIVCINPTFDNYEENVQVLKFAEASQDIKIPQSETKYITYKTKTPKTIKAFKLVNTPATFKAKLPSKSKCNLPNILLNLEDPEANIAILDNYITKLQNIKRDGLVIKQEIGKKKNIFRNQLLKIQQGSSKVENQMRNVKDAFTSAKLDNKITNLELHNKELREKNKYLQSQIQTLQIVVEEKNLKINSIYTDCGKENKCMF